MSVRKILRPSNRKVRLLVGIFLAGLFCVLCTTQTEGEDASEVKAELLAGQDGGRIEHLAKTDHIALLQRCLKNCRERYRDYTCTLIKKERIGGSWKPQQTMRVKFLAKPFSVAMKWTKNAPIAEKVLYVEGKYNNKMLVEPKGWLKRLCPVALRRPDGPDAMKNTLRPVNLFGFERSLISLLEVYRRAKRAGDLRTEFGGHYQIDGRKAILLRRCLPPKKSYPAYVTKSYIDLEHLVPIRVEGYDWEGQIFCQYDYKDVKFNIGLTPDDFLPESCGMARPK